MFNVMVQGEDNHYSFIKIKHKNEYSFIHFYWVY